MGRQKSAEAIVVDVRTRRRRAELFEPNRRRAFDVRTQMQTRRLRCRSDAGE